VIFLTGRSEPYRAMTENNLRLAGYTGYERYIGRPLDSPGTYARFKAGIRESLIAEGWIIIANLGDQGSDLAGGHAEKAFRLPNPFYVRE
jgi:acid phosphatase